MESFKLRSVVLFYFGLCLLTLVCAVALIPEITFFILTVIEQKYVFFQ
jgi:hypothetical protein